MQILNKFVRSKAQIVFLHVDNLLETFFRAQLSFRNLNSLPLLPDFTDIISFLSK